MRPVSLLIPVLLGLSVAAGCDSSQADDLESASAAAMDGGDRPWPFELVHLADLTPPDGALTPVPWGVAADPEAGRIYALDWTSPRVVYFDPAGEFVGEYAREGDGPGEFRNPVGLSLDQNGDLLVWDAGRAIISRWSREGTLIDEERVPVDLWGPGFEISLGGALTVTAQEDPSGGSMVQRLVLAADDSVATLHELRIELSPLEFGGATIPAQRIFAPSIVWASRGDDVYVRAEDGYRIDRYVRGSSTESYRRGLPPIPVTADMAVAAVAGGPGHYAGFLRRTGMTAEQLVRAIGHEPTVSPVQSIAVDHRDRLWVTRTEDGFSPSAVDVFSATGEYQGTMPVPGIPAAFPSDSTMVVLRLEASGLPVLGLYELRSEPAELD